MNYHTSLPKLFICNQNAHTLRNLIKILEEKQINWQKHDTSISKLYR